MKKKIQIILVLFLLAGCAPAEKEPAPVPDPSVTAETETPASAAPAPAAMAEAVKAEYPEIREYPIREDFASDNEWFDAQSEWYQNRFESKEQSQPYVSLIGGFSEKVRPVLLNADETENSLYAPLNLYIALSMLAECTGGNTEDQILDLLGAGSVQELRTAIPALWKTNYSTGKGLTSILSDSVWIDQGYPVREELLKNLAEYYYADSYYGEAGSAEMNAALQAWLNEATGGLLKDQAEKIELSELTRLALASAILYKAKWMDEFDPLNTDEGIFHAPQGDVPCEMMHALRLGTYYYFDSYSAISLPLENSGEMYFFLPEEGTDVRELLKEESVNDVLTQYEIPGHSVYSKIDMSIPKLDILSDRDLREDLKTLGITDVFDRNVSDFTPLSDEKGITLDQAVHAARLTTDEEGVFAAAFTVLAAAGAGMPPEEIIPFTLDRPFYFVLTSYDGSILFEGIVNHPKD